MMTEYERSSSHQILQLVSINKYPQHRNGRKQNRLNKEDFLCDIYHVRQSEYYVEYWAMIVYETITNKCLQDDRPGDDKYNCHECLINWSLGSKWNNNLQITWQNI